MLDVGCGIGALADFVDPNLYLGVEPDDSSRAKAKICFPNHRFECGLPADGEKFDTVVAMAVIEHVSNPTEFLTQLLSHLEANSTARLVCTTPHPAVDWIHDLGAAIGLFSKHASEEHEDLLDRASLTAAAAGARLEMVIYRRFLFGVNQLVVFRLKSANR